MAPDDNDTDAQQNGGADDEQQSGGTQRRAQGKRVGVSDGVKRSDGSQGHDSPAKGVQSTTK